MSHSFMRWERPNVGRFCLFVNVSQFSQGKQPKSSNIYKRLKSDNRKNGPQLKAIPYKKNNSHNFVGFHFISHPFINFYDSLHDTLRSTRPFANVLLGKKNVKPLISSLLPFTNISLLFLWLSQWNFSYSWTTKTQTCGKIPIQQIPCHLLRSSRWWILDLHTKKYHKHP